MVRTYLKLMMASATGALPTSLICDFEIGSIRDSFYWWNRKGQALTTHYRFVSLGAKSYEGIGRLKMGFSDQIGYLGIIGLLSVGLGLPNLNGEETESTSEPPEQAPAAAEEPQNELRRIVEENFESRFTEIRGPLENLLGTLPEGWSDVSGPGAVVFYGPVYDDVREGEKALRMEVVSPGRDSAVLEYQPIPIEKGRVLQMGLTLRSDNPTIITIGLRSNSEPAIIYFEQPIPCPLDWSSGEVVVQATVDDPEARFYVEIDKEARIEFDAFYVQPYRTKKGAVLPVIREESPNLLPSSSFPDGVHAPWVLLNAEYRYSDGLEIGPTGMPSLKWAGEGASLTAPFSGNGKGEYTLSLYLRGSVRGQRLSLILAPPLANPKIYPFHQRVVVDKEWKRYSTTVPLEIDIAGYYLAHIVSHSVEPVWVDGLQVEKAGQMTPLARTGPVEIVAQPLNPMGIGFEGEQMAVRVTIYGALTMAREVTGTLFDIDGRQYHLSPLKVTGSKPISRTVLLKDLDEPPLGSYRLQLQAWGDDDKAVSRPAEALLHRVRVPANPNQPARGSPFGIEVAHISERAEEIGVARALGFKWVRDTRNFTWKNAAPEPDSKVFEKADMASSVYQQLGMEVLAILGPAPAWALEQPEDFPLDLPLLPADRESWFQYVGETVNRFKGVIRAWEPWPSAYSERTLSALTLKTLPDPSESDIDSASQGSTGKEIQPILSSAEDYVAMQRTAYEAIKERAPTARVTVDLNLNGDRVKGRELLAVGIIAQADAISFQDDFEKASPLERLDEDISWLDDQMPGLEKFWQVQARANPSRIFNFYEHVVPVLGVADAKSEAAATVHFYLSLLSAKVERIFVPGYAIDPFEDLWQPGPRIFNVDGRLNPNASALSNMMRHLEGKQPSRVYSIEEHFDLFTFANEESAVGVLVSKDSSALKIKSLVEKVEARGLFGNLIEFPAEVGRTPTYFTAEGFSAAQMNFLFTMLSYRRVE